MARSSQIDFVVKLAAAGLGIAFLPRMIAEQRRHPSVRLVRLAEPETTFNLAIAADRRRTNKPKQTNEQQTNIS